MNRDELAREQLMRDAGLPHMPTELTYEYRKAVAGEGADEFLSLGYQWQDKPHRLVHDLCGYIEEQAALQTESGLPAGGGELALRVLAWLSGYRDLLPPEAIASMQEFATHIRTLEARVGELEGGVRSIRNGCKLSMEWFLERQGKRKGPIWYSVNALQDAVSAAIGTANNLLARHALENDDG